MSQNRMVSTRFWNDTFIREELNPLDRYLFLDESSRFLITEDR